MLTYKPTFVTVLFAKLLLSFLQLQSQSIKFEPIDVFELEYVSSPSISPDGKKVLYVRNFKDIMTDKNFSNIWMINFDGSNNIPLTIPVCKVSVALSKVNEASAPELPPSLN